MYRILIGLALLILAGCAQQYPLNTNLQLSVQSSAAGIYESGQSAAITSRDSRSNPEVIVYENEEEPVEITNDNPVHTLVAEQLADGLRRQDLTIDSSSPLILLVDIGRLKATVTRPEMIYHTKAMSQITLTLENQGKTLGKKYNVESSRESLTRPKVAELEALLETQLSDIIAQILEDDAIRSFIQNR